MTPRRVQRLAWIGFTASLAVLRAMPAAAQPSVDALVSGSFDRVTRTGGTATDQGSAPSGTLELEHLALGERLRVFYTLDTGTFSGDGDWHYLNHMGGARQVFDLPGGARLFVGGAAGARVNGDSWSSANYRALGAFSNVEWKRRAATLRGGLRLDVRRFTDEAALDQNELNVFSSALVSFQTRTTLIGEITWGAKRFVNGSLASVDPYVVDGPLADSTLHVGLGSGGGTMAGGNGRGNGIVNQGGQPQVAATSGTWPQAPQWRMGQVVLSLDSDSPARQVTVFGRVAQSLADRFAVSFEASRRNASGVVAPAVVETPEMLIDDGVYDDPFASDATTLRVGAKHAGANGRVLEAGFSHWAKFYEATPAYGLDGLPIPGVQRDDKVWRLDLTWREPIAQSRTGLVSLALVASYSFMDSISTDAYYTYDAHRFRLGVSVGY